MPRDEDNLDQRPLASAQGTETTDDLAELPRNELVARIKRLENQRDRAGRLEAKIDALTDKLGAVDHATPDPRLEDWTLDAFEAYVASRKSTGASTAAQYRNKVRIMEEHGQAPVELRPPDEDSWREHVRWRKEQGQANATLNTYQAAVQALLEYLTERTGRSFDWTSLRGSHKVEPPSWRLPPENLVPEFWHHRYFPEDELRTKLLQYVFRYLFLVGPRAPTEIGDLRLEHVGRIEDGYLEFPQRKKGGKLNERPDEPAHVLTSSTEKSLKNWLDVWRPKLDPETDQVFPRPDGTAWRLNDPRRPYPNLRKFLSRNGKQVWPGFQPYTGRRWYATRLLIETGLNLYAVADRLDDDVSTVQRHYVDKAKARAGHKADWQIPRLHRSEGMVNRD